MRIQYKSTVIDPTLLHNWTCPLCSKQYSDYSVAWVGRLENEDETPKAAIPIMCSHCLSLRIAKDHNDLIEDYLKSK